MDNPASPSSPEPAAPRKLSWETVFTATPVVLTILGTVLAGASTSEMTQAQYYRSLAAQNQSKVADQWGFFQAKRIRGQTLEASVDLLPVHSRLDKISPELVQAAANRLVQRLERGAKEVDRLNDAVNKAETGLGSSGEPLYRAAKALSETVQTGLGQAKDAQAELAKELRRDEVRSALVLVGSGKLPDVEDASGTGDPLIDDILKGIEDRKSEGELAPLLQRVSDESLRRTLDTAEGRARAFEVASKPINTVLERLERMIDAEAKQAAAFHQGVMTLDVALGELPEGTGKSVAEVREAGEAVLKSDAAIRVAAEDLAGIGRAARNGYNARRYDRDARFNQRAAALYEVEARRNSVLSDRYRTRSKRFFYGMLFAQAGAAIASLSLAAHRKNILWALAGVAGFAAIGFSGYVYVFM
jgi:hypothetical protein